LLHAESVPGPVRPDHPEGRSGPGGCLRIARSKLVA
jgi:hypothetical protein